MRNSSIQRLRSNDLRGRRTAESKHIGTDIFYTNWSYNSADQLSTMTYPSNNNGGQDEIVQFTYLPQGNLAKVNGAYTYLHQAYYDAAGRTKLLLYNTYLGPRTYYTYNAWNYRQGRLQSIQSGPKDNYTSVQNFMYGYDLVGNVNTITDYHADNQTQVQSFGYDELDRIISASATGGVNGLYSEQYGYNPTTGNLSSKAGVSYTYNATVSSCSNYTQSSKPHAISSTSNGNSYTYDCNGNMLSRTISGSTYTLSYDAENRMVGVAGATTATFVYDGVSSTNENVRISSV